MPNDRSDAALRERLKIAGKATPGSWSLQDKGAIPLVYGPNGERIAKAVDNLEDTAHIAASSPDVVREDIEEILQLRKERDWLLREIVNTSDRQFCPMPDRYECLYHVGHECKSREVEMRVGCWRTAVECAVKYEEEKNNAE